MCIIFRNAEHRFVTFFSKIILFLKQKQNKLM